MQQRISILGVPIDRVTRVEALAHVAQFLNSGQQHQIATPNPEMILAAQENPEFLRLLQTTSLNIPDGAGLLWAAGGKLKERVTGTDLMMDICGLPRIKIFLLGAAPGIAERARENINHSSGAGFFLRDTWVGNPLPKEITIVGTYSGSPKIEDQDRIASMINGSGANVLFVAFGAPAQELWIARNLRNMPSVKVAMGVGGAFDFIAGKRSRAPQFMQRLGIEWLWRLVQQPSRIGRIWNAVVVFPLRVMNAPKS